MLDRHIMVEFAPLSICEISLTPPLDLSGQYWISYDSLYLPYIP